LATKYKPLLVRGGEDFGAGVDSLGVCKSGGTSVLAEVSGRPPVHFRIPRGVALAWAYVDVALARLNPSHIPAATPERIRVSRRYEFYDSGKAVRELGLPQTPAREALRKAVEWYRGHGYAS
jgi:dihydroflavonol-4-reductase